jgi:hypothetical protein
MNKLELDKFNAEHQDFYERLGQLRSELSTKSPGELADIGYYLRELENTFDSFRKESKAVRDLVSKMIGVHVIQKSVIDPDYTSVTGKAARANPDVKIRVKTPREGTPEYAAMLKHFGIINLGVFKPDWNRISDYATEQAMMGIQLPECLRETFTEYVCTFTKVSKKSER